VRNVTSLPVRTGYFLHNVKDAADYVLRKEGRESMNKPKPKCPVCNNTMSCEPFDKLHMACYCPSCGYPDNKSRKRRLAQIEKGGAGE
jgi:rubredoxin